MSRAMLLSGAFTEADFAEILETVRAIEQRDTDKLYLATFHEVPGGDGDDDAETADAALAYIHRLWPGRNRPHNLKVTLETVTMMRDALRLYLAVYADRIAAPSAIEEKRVISAARAALAAAEPEVAEGGRAMTVAELRQILMEIKELGMSGRIDPDEVAGRDEPPLIVALGTIAGLATVALEGDTLPPQRIELNNVTWSRLTKGEPVVLHTNLGYRVELHWPRRA